MALTPEQKTQVAILEWLAIAYPLGRELAIRIGNEGKRSIAGHVLAKKMGLNKGASDIFFPIPARGWFGCFMEVKPDKWKPSGKKEKLHVDEQLAFIHKMREQGYRAGLVVGVDAGILMLTDYFETKPGFKHLHSNP